MNSNPQSTPSDSTDTDKEVSASEFINSRRKNKGSNVSASEFINQRRSQRQNTGVKRSAKDQEVDLSASEFIKRRKKQRGGGSTPERDNRIKELSSRISNLQQQSQELRNESIEEGEPTINPKTGSIFREKEIADEDSYNKARQMGSKVEELQVEKGKLEDERLYEEGSDETRAEMDESKTQQTFEETIKGLARGVINLPKSVTQFKSLYGDPEKQPGMFEDIVYAMDAANKFLGGARDSETLSADKELKNEDLSSAYREPGKLIPYLAGKVGEGVPSTLPGLGAAKLLSGAGRATQIIGTAAATSPLEMSAQYEDLEKTVDLNKELRERRSKLIDLQGDAARAGDDEAVERIDKEINNVSKQIEDTPQEVTPGDLALASATGLLAGGVEAVADVSLFKTISKSLGKSGLDETAKESAKKELAESLSDIAVKSSQQTSKAVATESATEGVQNTISNIGAKYGWSPDRELAEGLAESMVVGGLTGGVITGPTSAAGEAAGYAANKELQNRKQQIREKLEQEFEITDPEQDTQGTQDQPIRDEVTFEFDPEAAPEEQISQLENEREGLKAQKMAREARGEPTEDIDNALSDLESEVERIQQERQATDEVDFGEVREEQERRKREKRKQEVKQKLNTLERTEGEQVQYGEYEGTLTRDNEGNFVVDTGEAIVEVEDSQKDPSKRIEDLGLERQQKTEREAFWTGDNSVEITNSRTDTGEQETRSYEFESFNENDKGEVASVTLRDENGEQRTVRDPNIVSRLLIEDHFRGQSEDVDVDTQVNDAIDEVENETQQQEDREAIIDDTDPRVEDALTAIDDGRQLTPEENSAVKDWVDDTLDEIERTEPGNAEELVNQLGQFENEIDQNTIRPPQEQKGRTDLEERPILENEGSPNEDVTQETNEGVQEAPIGTPDNPVTANTDERYRSWVDREGDSSTPTITVKNEEAGKVIDYRSNNRKGLVEDFQRQGAPGLESANTQIMEEAEGLNDQEKASFLNDVFDSKGRMNPEVVLKWSEDPAEISEAIETRKEERGNQIGGDKHVTLTENYWAGGTPLSSSNVRRWGDWQGISQNIKSKTRNKEKYDGDLLAADQIAQEASSIMGTEVTPEEVVDSFVQYHQEAVGRPNEYSDPTTDLLADKFKEITGQKYTPEFGQRLRDAKQEYMENKSDAETASKLEDDGPINYNEVLEEGGAIAEFISDGKPLTKEEADYVNEQIQQFEQETETQEGETEAEIPSGQTEGVQSAEQQWRGFGSQQDFEQVQQVLDEAFRDQGGQANLGIDPRQFNALKPEVLKAGVKYGGYLLQKGVINFGDWANQMVSRIGSDITPALKAIYDQARENSDIDPNEFSSEEEVNQWIKRNASTGQPSAGNQPDNADQNVQEDSGLEQDIPVNEDSNKEFSDEFSESVGFESDRLSSSDVEQVEDAAQRLAGEAIIEGATNYDQFYSWVAQTSGIAPNGPAMRRGWNQATMDEELSNMLSINNKEGDLWTKVKGWLDDFRYGITKRMAVYNQRARDVENNLMDIFGRDYFSGENSKYLMSWAMDRVAGKAGNMVDDYINPNKPYSVLNKILRKVGSHPEINTANFNKLDELYEELAEANRNNKGKAKRIEKEIRDLTEQDDLQQFLIAKHAIESNRYSQEKNSERLSELQEEYQRVFDELAELESRDTNTKLVKTKIESKKDQLDNINREQRNLKYPLGMTTKEAKQKLNEFEQRGLTEALEDIASLVRKLDDMVLEMAVENGVVSQEDADNMREVYQYHIPANRKLTDEHGNLINNFGTTSMANDDVSIRSRKGSDRVIEHALSSIVSNFEDMVMHSFNNKAKADIAESIGREQARGNTNLGRVVDASEAEGAKGITEFTRPEKVRTYDEDGNPRVVERIKEKAIIWADPEMANAVNQTDMTSTNGLPGPMIQAMRGIINLERFVLTGGNPTFMLTNPVKDTGDAAFNLGNRSSFKEAFKLLKNATIPEFKGKDGSKAAWNDRIFAAHRAIVAYENGNKSKNELTELFGELKEEGGTSSFFRFKSTKDIVGQIDGLVEDIRAMEQDGITSPKKMKSLFNKKMQQLELINEAMENATRLAVYKTMREAGKTKAEAARLGKEATVNFDMQGTWSPWFKLGYLFFQVGINSITSVAKGVKRNPGKSAIAGAALTTTGFAIAALRDAMSEEDDEYYKDKENNLWKYESNLNFKIPGTEYDFSIPMGYQVSTFTGFGGHLYDYMNGYSTGEEFMSRSASAAVSVYNPLGGSQMFRDGESFGAAVAPTGIKPLVEVAVNRSYFGPIYNEMMEASPNVSDYQLRSPGDRWISTMLSNFLMKEADISMSPKTFDHFIEFAGGGLLRDVEGAGEELQFQYNKWLGEKKEGEPEQDDSPIKPEEWPVLRRFVQKVDPVRLSYQNVWNQVNKLDNPQPIDSEEFQQKMRGIQKDYQRAKESGMFKDYMFDAMDNAINQYLNDNYKAVTKRKTIRYFRQNNMTGSENKQARMNHYKLQNRIAKKGAEFYPDWENGSFQTTQSRQRDKFTNGMIEDIEVKVNDITDTSELNPDE